ncbi:hypothetical protein C2845_PM03G14590 [Panicum miliaceum]|uniref:Uncharacterized protein n=1 Tax=Panicum miliaceum TaxID=4540 RepID=A0A3L6TBQ0_PANMI|nr:hypothetical protein C2845_PM03G14590 [Panicum miliaceum]
MALRRLGVCFNNRNAAAKKALANPSMKFPEHVQDDMDDFSKKDDMDAKNTKIPDASKPGMEGSMNLEPLKTTVGTKIYAVEATNLDLDSRQKFGVQSADCIQTVKLAWVMKNSSASPKVEQLQMIRVQDIA